MKNITPYVLSSSELRALQLVLLDMLIEVDRICKKKKIRYCLIAGTLLGAVRHKGFIPWDDDLDIGLMRDEYERFKEACKTELDGSRFFYQDHTTDPDYFLGYARIRRKDSVFLRVGQEHLNIRTGIFLDVFPLDAVPDLAPLRGIFTFWCFFLRKTLYSRSGVVKEKNVVKRFVYRVLCKIPLKWAFGRIDNIVNFWRNKTCNYVRLLTFPTPKGRRYGLDRSWFEELTDIEFEGKMFPGSKNIDDHLTYYYGDYMTLPPANKRWWHPVSDFKLPDKEKVTK